jgi:hypothetical protein
MHAFSEGVFECTPRNPLQPLQRRARASCLSPSGSQSRPAIEQGSRLVYRFTISQAIYRVYQGRSFLPAPGQMAFFYQGSAFYQVPSIYQGSERSAGMGCFDGSACGGLLAQRQRRTQQIAAGRAPFIFISCSRVIGYFFWTNPHGIGMGLAWAWGWHVAWG